jgi:hypothetical protein
MNNYREIPEFEQPILSKGRIAISFLVGLIAFSIFFALGYGIALSITQLLELGFMTVNVLTIIATATGTLVQVGVIKLFNRNKREYIYISLIIAAIIGIAANVVFMIFNIIGSYDIFNNISFIIANIFIYIYAKRSKE